jgi:hypothetical protein
MLRCVMDFMSTGKAVCFLGRECFILRGNPVDIQIVQHENRLDGLRILPLKHGPRRNA